MSPQREIARAAVGTLGATVNLVRLVIWVPVGLVLLLGIAGVVLAPILKHLANYWWVYVLAISALIAAFWYVVFKHQPPTIDAAHAVPQPPDFPSQAQQVSLQAASTTPQQPAVDRPTSGYALFRFTEEWITRNGLYEGRDMSKGDAIKIAGRTAISYHLREGNFSEGSGRIALTAKGIAHFVIRRSRL